MSLIKFERVSKIYPNKSVGLNDINLEIPKGEFLLVVGKTGSGKSTLLKMINREEEPSSGKVFFNSADIGGIKKGELQEYRQEFGTIFQDIRLINSKSVFENIAFAMEMIGATDEDILRDVPQILDMVGLKAKSACFPQELSGGEKQKVAIARALIHRPDVILADEPTGSLDAYNTRDVVETLQKLNSFGATILLATHNEKVVNLLKKRVITLEDGQIVRDQPKGKFIL
jgi:cell division transport system ATP-binding protein